MGRCPRSAIALPSPYRRGCWGRRVRSRSSVPGSDGEPVPMPSPACRPAWQPVRSRRPWFRHRRPPRSNLLHSRYRRWPASARPSVAGAQCPLHHRGTRVSRNLSKYHTAARRRLGRGICCAHATCGPHARSGYRTADPGSDRPTTLTARHLSRLCNEFTQPPERLVRTPRRYRTEQLGPQPADPHRRRSNTRGPARSARPGRQLRRTGLS